MTCSRRRATCGLVGVALLLSGMGAVSEAEVICECQGQAQLFRLQQRYAEIRVGKVQTCGGHQCQLLEGTLVQVFFAASAQQGSQAFARGGGQQLRARPTGHTFEFQLVVTDTDGVQRSVWTIKP